MQSACAVLYCRLWPVRLYHVFPRYFINGTIFVGGGEFTEHKIWFPLQLLSETFLILRRIHRDIVINVHRSYCKVPASLVIFKETWIFSKDSEVRYQILWRSIQWGPSCSTRAGGRTDITRQLVFCNFCERAKKVIKISSYVQEHGRDVQCHKQINIEGRQVWCFLVKVFVAESTGGKKSIGDCICW